MTDNGAKLQPRFDAAQVTAALAVLGLIGSIVYSFAVTEARVSGAVQAVTEVKTKADLVPELRWEIAQLKRDVDRIDGRTRSMETKLSEIHETIIRMGVVVRPKP